MIFFSSIAEPTFLRQRRVPLGHFHPSSWNQEGYARLHRRPLPCEPPPLASTDLERRDGCRDLARAGGVRPAQALPRRRGRRSGGSSWEPRAGQADGAPHIRNDNELALRRSDSGRRDSRLGDSRYPCRHDRPGRDRAAVEGGRLQARRARPARVCRERGARRRPRRAGGGLGDHRARAVDDRARA